MSLACNGNKITKQKNKKLTFLKGIFKNLRFMIKWLKLCNTRFTKVIVFCKFKRFNVNFS